jgi:hypothetical protein
MVLRSSVGQVAGKPEALGETLEVRLVELEATWAMLARLQMCESSNQ